MDAVDEVKQRLSVEDVVGEYVQLKRAGRNFRGLSPWTSEKTPSLMVSPDKQIWHDFSSGKGGNIFSFVMELEGLDFKGALELLARKAGVDLDQYRQVSPGRTRRNKERLFEANELAAHFYQTQFIKNASALDYVSKKRQFTKETALAWRLGYSPASGTALTDYLKSKKFTSDEIKRAGLSNSYGKDMFRGRLMVPLADPQGRIIGFTARILTSGEPKYINTPATLIYDKSRHVYGLHLAKEAIRKTSFVVLAEGNLDVIASHQAGAKNVVATAGTALTPQHLKTLARFTSDIRLAFDADKAGLAATERAIPLASRAGASLSIITIPSGKDPDELIKQDASKWQEIIEKPQYALDWLIDQYRARLDLAQARGKREFSDVLLPVVARLEDKVEQDHYISRIAEILSVSVESLKDKMASAASEPLTPKRRYQPPPEPTLTEKQAAELAKIQDRIMTLVLLEPKLRDFLTLARPDMLFSNDAKQLAVFLTDNPDFAGDPTVETALRPIDEYVSILSLQYEELYKDVPLIELRYEAARLQARIIEHYVKTQKQRLASRMRDTDENDVEAALAEAKQLDILLKQAKEA
jgi:DNA primase